MKNIFVKLGTFGNSIALLCLIHCMAMPILIAVLPAMGLFLLPSWIDKTIIILAVLCTLVSLCWGYRVHGNMRLFALLLASTMWLWIAHDTRCPVLFSFVGAICMFAANFMNRRLCTSCGHCSSPTPEESRRMLSRFDSVGWNAGGEEIPDCEHSSEGNSRDK